MFGNACITLYFRTVERIVCCHHVKEHFRILSKGALCSQVGLWNSFEHWVFVWGCCSTSRQDGAIRCLVENTGGAPWSFSCIGGNPTKHKPEGQRKKRDGHQGGLSTEMCICMWMKPFRIACRCQLMSRRACFESQFVHTPTALQNSQQASKINNELVCFEAFLLILKRFLKYC